MKRLFYLLSGIISALLISFSSSISVSAAGAKSLYVLGSDVTLALMDTGNVAIHESDLGYSLFSIIPGGRTHIIADTLKIPLRSGPLSVSKGSFVRVTYVATARFSQSPVDSRFASFCPSNVSHSALVFTNCTVSPYTIDTSHLTSSTTDTQNRYTIGTSTSSEKFVGSSSTTTYNVDNARQISYYVSFEMMATADISFSSLTFYGGFFVFSSPLPLSTFSLSLSFAPVMSSLAPNSSDNLINAIQSSQTQSHQDSQAQINASNAAKEEAHKDAQAQLEYEKAQAKKEEEQRKRDEEKANQSQTQSKGDSDNAQSDVNSKSQSLFSVLTTFSSAIVNTSAGDCGLSANFGFFDAGNIDLCSGASKITPITNTVGTVMLVGLTIPAIISLLHRFVDLYNEVTA